MRDLIDTLLMTLAILIAGDIAAGGNHIEGFGE